MLTLNLEQLTELYPEHIWLDIADRDRQAAAQAEQYPYSHDAARARAYLNTLCLECLQRELPEMLDRPDPIRPAADDLAKRWEFVTGFSVTIGNVPLVIIPTDTLTLDELRVPREWVDIPSWVAPYYVACQVDEEEGWIRIAGYATHDEIKCQEGYDPVDRSYSLPISDLTDNLYTIWHLRAYVPDPQPEVQSSPALSNQDAERLIHHYSQPVPYSPRLLPAPEGDDRWLTLLANPTYLNQLYACRTSVETQNSVVGETLAEMQRRVLEVFGEGWRLLDDLINPPVLEPAIAMKSAKYAQGPAYKPIELNGQTFLLEISFAPLASSAENPEINVCIQVYPGDSSSMLPDGLTLAVRDAQENLIDGDRSSLENTLEPLKAEIIGSPGEPYSIELFIIQGSKPYVEACIIPNLKS